jgi:hypothetical protein
MILIAQHWSEDARVWESLYKMGMLCSKSLAHNKKGNLYTILESLLLVGYLLQEL